MWFFRFSNACVNLSDWTHRRKRYVPHSRTSKGERYVASVLDKLGVEYEEQYPLGYYIHTDFAVNIDGKLHLIEYNGKQHFTHVKHFNSRFSYFLQRLRDWTEKKECESRGIPLLTIRYDVPMEEIEQIVEWFLFPQKADIVQQSTYPVILQPKRELTKLSFSVPADKGKTRRRGASELIALGRIAQKGYDFLRDDVVVKIGRSRYEPDFAWIGDGFCVDIEIDEPYTTTGIPTHYMKRDGTNSDSKRNTAFQAEGWYVIRFTEEQMFCHFASCMKTIYQQLIADGHLSVVMPEQLKEVQNLPSTHRWSFSEALHMAENKQREHYLGFEPSHMDVRGFFHATWLFMQLILQGARSKRVRKQLWTQTLHFVRG